jgi:hypothetical protein
MGALGKRGKARIILCSKRCDIVMGLKAATNQWHRASGNWSILAWVIQLTRKMHFQRDNQIRPMISVRRQADSFQPKPY